MSATLAATALSLCHNMALAHSDVQLHPKMPVFGLQFCFISESRGARGDDGRFHDRPQAQQQPPFFQSPVIELNIAWVSLCCSAGRKAQNPALAWHRLLAQLDPRKAPYRLVIIARLFGLWVR